MVTYLHIFVASLESELIHRQFYCTDTLSVGPFRVHAHEIMSFVNNQFYFFPFKLFLILFHLLVLLELAGTLGTANVTIADILFPS